MSYCVIKADDLRNPPSAAWVRFLEYGINRKLPVALGFIPKKSDRTGQLDSKLTEMLEAGHYDLFHHGLTHAKDDEAGTFEFQGRTLDEQIHSLENGQLIAENLFNSRHSMFGPPYNKTDCNTIRALRQFPEIDFVFDVPYIPEKRTAPVAYYVGCEGPRSGRTFDVKLARDKAKRFRQSNLPFVLQIHPGNHWEPDCLTRFDKFLAELESDGYEFRHARDSHWAKNSV